MRSTQSRAYSSEKDIPRTHLERLIECGTGILILPTDPLISDPLSASEARHVSWHAAEPYIQRLETIKDLETRERIERDLLRFAVLHLADLALSASRTGRRMPVKLSTTAQHVNAKTLSPDKAFTLLHHRARRGQQQRARKRGRPSYADVLSVLSGLSWHLEVETEHAHLPLLVNLLRCVYPPLFLLHSRRHREAHRQLSEAIRKYRRRKGTNGERDYQELHLAMTDALLSENHPSQK
jgi:hypothetical protein